MVWAIKLPHQWKPDYYLLEKSSVLAQSYHMLEHMRMWPCWFCWKSELKISFNVIEKSVNVIIKETVDGISFKMDGKFSPILGIIRQYDSLILNYNFKYY